MSTAQYNQSPRWEPIIESDISMPKFRYISKRCLDIVISATLISALSPILLLIALLIRATSRGPAIYKQQRRGLGGETFECYKFRTMYLSGANADFVQCRKHDARVTRIGQSLRRTSVDELPQLFNVLLGTMSLVGPRPHPLKLDDQFSTKIPGYTQRFLVKPGITGLAQIRGYRGPTESLKDMQCRIAADQAYVRNQSLKLDIGILLATIPSVFKGTNAF